MPYEGPERRIHQVFVTQNSEYHVRENLCVAVRDRESGEWLRSHFAVRRPVVGSMRFFESGAISASAGLPELGESLYFEELGRDLVTGSVIAVERPERAVLGQYNAEP
jgi:hypothetical protein